MGSDMTNAQKQQKVNIIIFRFASFVVLFKPLTTLKKEFRPIWKEKFIKDFLNSGMKLKHSKLDWKFLTKSILLKENNAKNIIKEKNNNMIAENKKMIKNLKNLKNLKNPNKSSNLNLSIYFLIVGETIKPAYRGNKDNGLIVQVANVESRDNGRGKDPNNVVNEIRTKTAERTAEIVSIVHDLRREKNESITEKADNDRERVVKKNAIIRIQRSIERNTRRTVQNHGKKRVNKNIDRRILQ